MFITSSKHGSLEFVSVRLCYFLNNYRRENRATRWHCENFYVFFFALSPTIMTWVKLVIISKCISFTSSFFKKKKNLRCIFKHEIQLEIRTNAKHELNWMSCFELLEVAIAYRLHSELLTMNWNMGSFKRLNRTWTFSSRQHQNSNHQPAHRINPLSSVVQRSNVYILWRQTDKTRKENWTKEHGAYSMWMDVLWNQITCNSLVGLSLAASCSDFDE